jgi:hypothetical protein
MMSIGLREVNIDAFGAERKGAGGVIAEID